MYRMKIVSRLCLSAFLAASVLSGCGASQDVTYFAGGAGDGGKGSGTVTYVDESGATKTETVSFPWTKTVSVSEGTKVSLTVKPVPAVQVVGQIHVPIRTSCQITIGGELKQSSGLREAKAACEATA
ncbi:hypothetical protein [Catellatospora tritici]|uniref:hypothetical protein n=1 Tax=Catellatospora tritici TaxID=2851566 RepID=UPI001C2D4734|nr:hypothetical protein [Catellatospora tritici]MBV1848694.1 hypothetical protein [Catellatospora tritici]